MEPGDLRINSRLREESGVPKSSPGPTFATDGGSVLHFRNHVRPPVITDGRLHHIPSPHSVNPLLVDRNEPVKVWRDPTLMNSGEIRHVVSMQHFPSHSMVPHGNVSSGANVYHHHDNKPMDTSSRGMPLQNTDGLRGRAPIIYAPPPHPTPPSKAAMEPWRGGVMQQNSKDFRVNVTAKSTVEQAVHDHFVESLRLAQLKGSTQQAVVKQDERLNSHPSSIPMSHMQPRYYPPPHPPDKRLHDMPPGTPPQVIYQIHQHQQHQQHQQSKQELPAPPPLRSEPQQYRGGPVPGVESVRKHQIYGNPEIIPRSHLEAAQQQQQGNVNVRYEQEQMSRLEVHPSENSVRYQKLPPAPTPPRRPPTREELQQLERNRSPFGKPSPPVASPNSFHMYPQAHMGKHKVSSPAPPHIYGKPGPSTRPYEMGSEVSAPLSLTSKGGLTRPSQSSPTSYSHSPSLPQHDMRKSDVAYYMYNNGPPGFQPSMSPQAHMHAIQTQPLDLGGKRKVDEEMYKGPIPDYSDHTPVKQTIYGSRKPVVDDPRHKLPPNHINSSLPLSLTVSEAPPKRKMEDVPMSLHLDTKKVRSDVPVSSVGAANLVMGRKEPEGREMKQATTSILNEFPMDKNRVQLDNHQVPVSLIVTSSNSDIRIPRPESAPSIHHHHYLSQIQHQQHPQPSTSLPPADIRRTKPVVTIGAIDLPQTTASLLTSTVVSPSMCNGKHKEILENRNLTATPEKKVEPEVKVKVETTAAATTTTTTAASISSVSATTSTVSQATTSTPPSTPSKFQKVPKKAWVLQWHEGDNASRDDVARPTPLSGRENASNNSIPTSTSSPQDKKSPEDSSDKLVNGHIATTGEESEGKPAATGGGAQSVNGFGKEKLNESDIGSENESDNSGKDKGMTDPGSSPTKKGRKGKEVGQASPKPDLRKDGLCKRPPVSQLKKTGESFIQAETCNREIKIGKIGKCRECRWHPSGRGSKKQSGAYCRFYGFRKLRYTKGGTLTVAGFSDPFADPAKITEHDQFQLWLPSPVAPMGLDIVMSKFLLSQLCDQFCDLVRQEEEARCLVCTQESSTIVWKPLLKGVREMCDVCDTTLFNFHWACGKCGFVVCLSCFKARKNESDEGKAPENPGKDRDEFQWLLCSNRGPHELDKLMLVQTIAGDALIELNKVLHSTCAAWDIVLHCDCKELNAIAEGRDISKSETNVLQEKSDSTDEIKPEAGETNSKSAEKESTATPEEGKLVVSDGNPTNGCKSSDSEKDLEHFKRMNTNEKVIRRNHFFFKDFASSESSKLHRNVKHTWLCNGRLLRLLDPQCSENSAIFHELWKRGHPVLVSNVAAKLDKNLWTPESFAKDLGDYKNDLVDCNSGKVVPNQQMKKFWEGFTSVNKRIKDDKGDPMILKLKDWPPTDDFAQTLPTRFDDLMAVLPLPEYTLRDGRLNMASRLPVEFMKSDLGPKMYVAYGSASSLDKGTTNLHIDVSDTVNVLVYSEPPSDTELVEHEKAVMNAIEESDCDVVTINRVLQNKEVPGAIWHVYDKMDADKIRSFLNKVAIERGVKVEAHHDSIHDQSWYLDKKLRHRLQSECEVNGYPILQCAGDAIFIPAGAPHQVCNLQNCIKVAEDFVSPESISHSFYLAEEEFRNLRRTRTNHEDKLQIKNIVYHTVKDAISVLIKNKEKSESPKKDADESTNTIPKDCALQPNTSPRELAPVV